MRSVVSHIGLTGSTQAATGLVPRLEKVLRGGRLLQFGSSYTLYRQDLKTDVRTEIAQVEAPPLSSLRDCDAQNLSSVVQVMAVTPCCETCVHLASA